MRHATGNATALGTPRSPSTSAAMAIGTPRSPKGAFAALRDRSPPQPQGPTEPPPPPHPTCNGVNAGRGRGVPERTFRRRARERALRGRSRRNSPAPTGGSTPRYSEYLLPSPKVPPSTIQPSFMMTSMLSTLRARMSAATSPLTTSRSAHLPASSEPVSSSM